MLERALGIGRRKLDPDHPFTALVATNLAVVLRRRGDQMQAGGLLARALEARRRRLGRDHPDVAVSLVALADLLRDQGRDAEAEPLRREAAEIRAQALGPERANSGDAGLSVGRTEQ
jgi:tetratricopeptide (TPR) repeat protein